MQVTNKVLTVFFTKKILLDTNTFSISTSFEKIRVLLRQNLYFQFQYPQTLKFRNLITM